jgi:hypothetical protein
MDAASTETKKRQRAEPQELESRTFKDGAIYLYRRAEYKKPTWYVRLKIPGAKGYVWKSSRSTDEYVAYKGRVPGGGVASGGSAVAREARLI